MAGLYLHIPFCRRKCPYCDFFSVCADAGQLEAYPDLLCAHLDWARRHGWGGPFDTVYFGGGTPSLLPAATVARLLREVDRTFGLATDAEITLEANPGTVTPADLEGFRAAGVNRLSLGLQSCDAGQLQRLGRLHGRDDGFNAVRWARAAGFDNLSLDLMFALPGQSLADLDTDLACYLELSPEHLSCYGLTAEPHTPFGEEVVAGSLALPDEDLYAEAFLLVHQRLGAAGYDHYEIANYARPGRACRHNLGYWARRSYLGIGAGAHTFRADGWGSRWAIPPDLESYRQALDAGREPLQRLEEFDRASALSEAVYLALRTRQGVADAELVERFGCTLAEAFPAAVAASAPWLQSRDGRWALDPAGWLLFDRLILPFL